MGGGRELAMNPPSRTAGVEGVNQTTEQPCNNRAAMQTTGHVCRQGCLLGSQAGTTLQPVQADTETEEGFSTPRWSQADAGNLWLESQAS